MAQAEFISAKQDKTRVPSGRQPDGMRYEHLVKLTDLYK